MSVKQETSHKREMDTKLLTGDIRNLINTMIGCQRAWYMQAHGVKLKIDSLVQGSATKFKTELEQGNNTVVWRLYHKRLLIGLFIINNSTSLNRTIGCIEMIMRR